MDSSETVSLVRDIESDLKVIINTGRVVFGAKTVERALKGRRVKVVLLAKNAPQGAASKISSMTASKDIPTFKSTKSNRELGSLCGRPHIISALAVLDFGASAMKQRLK
jgi:large subunit ribosomal protein L30e